MTKRFLSNMDFCVIDTETTGGKALDNRVIEVAVFRFSQGEIVEKFTTLVNPERPIPSWISRFTGISDEMVKHAPSFQDIAPALQSILGKGIFTAHNAGFDYSFIREEFKRLGKNFDRPQCCTLRLSRHLLPELPSRNLGTLCEHFLIDIWDRHRAYGDAEATVYVLKELLALARKHHGIETWDDLDGFAQYGRLELPAGISFQTISRLPVSAGVYSLRDEAGDIIHQSPTKNIQRRIRNFFKATNQSKRSIFLRQVVRSIQVERLYDSSFGINPLSKAARITRVKIK